MEKLQQWLTEEQYLQFKVIYDKLIEYDNEFDKRQDDTTWHGFWKKCNGKDAKMFKVWVECVFKFDKYKDCDLMKWYKKERLCVKHIPYGVQCAHHFVNNLKMKKVG
jgi:hypothetical protein